MRVLLFLVLLISLSYAKDYVLASSYPIYYPLRYIAGDRFEVDVFIKSQADPHHYELKPDDVRRLQRAKAFLYLGLEGWERKVVNTAGKDRAYPLAQGLTLIRVGRGYDPHLWLSPKAYMGVVENIQKVLSQLDPAGSEQYKRRASEYMERLRALDKEYREVLSTCKTKTLVITHLSTAYLGRDYELEMVGLRGVHAEEEPRPSEVRRMIERARRAKVGVVFAELGQDERLARRVAQEVGARVLTLNSSLFPEERNDDYFSIMRRNLERLSEGLECQRR
ncbi:metal ABC transporter substrate-binding protein [Pampinifervens florentissimum]|uniref:metal ABC transporter substrate-binding protein n=1 Tax=Pampinifervens florentissimum TaxID=1632019 RepID=UPI0013B48E7C|nr:metal ABC transporter substrate-binding protein [Hydrogenobacter sp. T-8]QID33128.1 zinc ABC transporter substrate-binding protein [Hydrogenobacter sp. T-8]